MTSQIVANIDSTLKSNAMEMAKANWITLKSLITLLLKGYVSNEITLWVRMKRDYWNSDIENTIEDIKVTEGLQRKMNSLSNLK